MQFKTVFFILIFIISHTFVGLSQKESPPEGGQPKDFKLPAVQKYTLDNGMQVKMVSYGEMPKVNVRVVVRAGNLNEDANETWLSDITIDLLKEGTQSYQAEEIAKKVANMGGEITTSTGLDQSWVGGEVLSEFAPDLIALLADIVQNPTFPEKEFERVKKDFIRILNILMADCFPLRKILKNSIVSRSKPSTKIILGRCALSYISSANLIQQELKKRSGLLFPDGKKVQNQ
jgi:hypothetical protein